MKMWYIYIVKYYPALKKIKFPIIGKIYKKIILKELTQIQKQILYVLSILWLIASNPHTRVTIKMGKYRGTINEVGALRGK